MSEPRVRQTKPDKRREGRESTKPIRWNLNQAAREFGMPREMLARRQRETGIQAGEDGCFTTKQISAMVFGDKEAEALGKIAAERKSTEMRNAREMGELMPTAVAQALCEPMMVVIRQKICASGMSDAEKDDLLNELRRLGEIDWAKEAKNALKRSR